ncbi:PAS domain-containing protein [Acidobacterium sp. S8]|uniref:PAS domain-containing protein n=1 Tax=Acidobacterium sp. S8 TaxID=1641854 RepID=UPI00131CA316|nr:PAS domain-containing protein [Acidobacterium sp. S8]
MSFAFCGLEDRNRRVIQRPFGENVREDRIWPRDLAVFAFILSLLAIQGVATAQVQTTRRILILNQTNDSYPAIPIINQGIQTALSILPYRLEFYSEYLDPGLFPDPAVQQEFRDFYIRKYRNRQPDVIITVGPAPLKFMQEAHQRAFPGVPIVFCLPTGDVSIAPALDSDFTGVESDFSAAQTLQIALKFQPGTEHVVVLGGVSDMDKRLQALLKQQIKGLTDHLEITYMTDVAVPELPERLKHLPRHTLVLLLTYGSDAAGNGYKSNEIGPLVAAAANAPVFTFYDVYLNHGEVGGYLSNLNEQGKVAGSMALRLLQGEKPQDIPQVKGVNTYMFDWRAMKRWSLKESEIPPDSIVLNRQPTAWESYKWYIIGGLSLMTVESALIIALIWQRARRRGTERELSLMYDRFLMAVEAGRSVGWDADLRKGRNRWFGDLQTIFGIRGDTHDGHLEDFRSHVHPEDLVAFETAVAEARDKRRSYAAEFRVVRKDGDFRWISARGRFYFTPNGEPERMLGMAADITERKLAEEALNSLSGRLIQAQEAERSRIAREIHDDYQQRLALLSIDLENLARYLERDSEGHDRLRELWDRVGELGSDLHSLSHRLHSATLDNLGLVAALGSLCTEFSDYHSIKVNFVEENVPRNIPSEVALCLFRITQEALQNVKKHSRADSAEVRVEGLKQKIHLSISDCGTGFNQGAALRRSGIGIWSMEERVRLVGGQFAVHSRPGEGTKIDVWLPIGS